MNASDVFYEEMVKKIAEEMAKEIDAHLLEQMRRESLTQEERDMEDVINKLKNTPKKQWITIDSVPPIDTIHVNAPVKKLTVTWAGSIYESKKN